MKMADADGFPLTSAQRISENVVLVDVELIVTTISDALAARAALVAVPTRNSEEIELCALVLFNE